jgi:hypothetical protein
MIRIKRLTFPRNQKWLHQEVCQDRGDKKMGWLIEYLPERRHFRVTKFNVKGEPAGAYWVHESKPDHWEELDLTRPAGGDEEPPTSEPDKPPAKKGAKQ